MTHGRAGQDAQFLVRWEAAEVGLPGIVNVDVDNDRLASAHREKCRPKKDASTGI